MNIDFLKKLKSTPKIKKEKFDVKAGTYWKFVIFFFFVLILGAFGFGYYLFESVNKIDEDINTNTNLSNESIQEERLNDTLNYFTKREEKFNAVIAKPAPIIDPSL